MQSRRLRWGVLSTARIADAQVRAISMSTNSELTAVASRDLTLAQAWAKQREVAYAFGSYEEMLASDAVDVVYIPLPTGLHHEWSIKAMQNGKHVLCEKPLAANAAEVREIIAAAEATGLKAMEAFMYRFHPLASRLAQLLAEGAIGTPKVIRASFGFALNRPDDIRWSAELAGGAIMDVGCYCTNISLMLAGAKPHAVTAGAVWAPTGVDESLVGTLEFPGGLLAAVDCSFKTGTVLQQSLTVSGTEGLITAPQPFRKGDGPAEITVDRADGGDNPGLIEVIRLPEVYQNHLMIEHFADAVLNDRPLAYTLQESLANMQVIDALKESARAGKRIEIGS